MYRFWALFIGSFLIATWALLGCAPKSATAPPAAQAPASAASDAAWAKVIQEAKREGSINAYSYHLTGDQGAAMTSAFEKRYGIRVEVTSGPGTQLIERIKTESTAGQKTADFLTTAVGILQIAKDTKLTQSVGDLPSLRGGSSVWRLPPVVDAPDGHIIAFSALTYNPFINTNLVQAGQEPRSFKDFLGAKWQGKILQADPASDPTINLLYQVFTSRSILGNDYFASVGKQNLVKAPQFLEMVQMLSRGSGAGTLVITDETASTFIAKGAPIKAIPMEEGTLVLTGSAISLIASGPHPNAARLFIDWWLSAEGQETWAKAAGSTPILKRLPAFVAPTAAVEPKKVIAVTLQDWMEASKLQRDRVLVPILFGK